MLRTLCIALVVLAMPAAAQQANHIDFTQVLKGFDGKPIVTGKDTPPLTLSDVALAALETPMEGDGPLTGAQKFHMDELARKVYNHSNAVLTAEDTALLKDRIAKAYGPLIVGITWRILDPSK